MRGTALSKHMLVNSQKTVACALFGAGSVNVQPVRLRPELPVLRAVANSRMNTRQYGFMLSAAA